MKKNQESFPELLLQLFRKVPWWVGPILIAATFVILRWAIPSLLEVPNPQFDPSTPEKGVAFGGQVFWNGIAGFSRLAAPWTALFILAVWIVGVAFKYRDAKQSDT